MEPQPPPVIKRVFVSSIQMECEPPIPLSICLVYADGKREFLDNDLDLDDLVSKYGNKISPQIVKEVEEDRYSLFDEPLPEMDEDAKDIEPPEDYN